ncbi:phasin family protein [Roseomonas sp. OT10]|uniref:phasin family protein n=1 Tax=Roseomonas cutis TaxID=2897332 RepID=UPI001E497AFB|nr:phasin family protein [Roseomonas sp. OT10]UFN50888.1 phasin family protein [Roseomonas sp. OT10]
MSDRPPSDFDPARFFAEMRLPGLPDMEALAAAQRRNLEALSAANRVALEGAQAVAKRHAEILQQSMSEMTDAMRSVAGEADPQGKAAKQAEVLKATYERAVSNMKELADLIQRSNTEALSLLNRRFTEAMDEVRSLVAKKG